MKKNLFWIGLSVISVWAAVPVMARSNALVQIAVEVVELDEQKTQKFGVDWINLLHVGEANVPAIFTLGTLTRNQIALDIQALMEQGAADLLANPKLVTRDGTSADFHAGGELPYAVAGSLGTATVEFKPYGVDLKITPKLTPAGDINLDLSAEVSGPDNQNSVTLSGNVVPGIRSRRVSSQLTLSPGETLTMAGLIQSQKEWKRKGLPILGQIPLLKYLFSAKVEDNRRTSVVVFVTPNILDAGNFKPKKAAAPPDDVTEPAEEMPFGPEPEEVLRALRRPVPIVRPRDVRG